MEVDKYSLGPSQTFTISSIKQFKNSKWIQMILQL